MRGVCEAVCEAVGEAVGEVVGEALGEAVGEADAHARGAGRASAGGRVLRAMGWGGGGGGDGRRRGGAGPGEACGGGAQIHEIRPDFAQNEPFWNEPRRTAKNREDPALGTAPSGFRDEHDEHDSRADLGTNFRGPRDQSDGVV